MTKFFVLLPFFMTLFISRVWAEPIQSGQPIVRADKTHFASGEAVFFWVGVKATDHLPIPKEDFDTCRLLITRPDGTQKTEDIGWPADGIGIDNPGDEGWEGGAGLGERAEPGRYRVVFEFADQKTAPLTLTVDSLPILKKIKASFVFGSPTVGGDGTDLPVTLTVLNESDQTLRFPHRDGLNAPVSISLRKIDGSYSNDGFYPANLLIDQDEPKLPDGSFTFFSWKDAEKFATITLRPGETYQQELFLRPFVAEAEKEAAAGSSSPIPTGRYHVTFMTTLDILIGEPEGDYANISPVRIPVLSTTNCEITP